MKKLVNKSLAEGLIVQHKQLAEGGGYLLGYKSN